jgi:hypothetical protein
MIAVCTPSPRSKHGLKDDKSMGYLSESKAFYQTYIEPTQAPQSCSSAEVEALELLCGHTLPLAYRQYLLWMGKEGTPLQPYEWLTQHAVQETTQLFQSTSRSANFSSLPQQCFIISYKSYKFEWFFLPSDSDDPAVYSCEATTGSRICTQLLGTFSEFLWLKLRARSINTLAGLIIGVTGCSTMGHTHKYTIEEIIKDEGGIIGNKDIWQKDQIIVVGRNNFDKQYLEKSVEIGLQFGFTCRYMAQEDFSSFLLSFEYPRYHKGDPRVKEHRGLSFLTSIGFKWPSLDNVETALTIGDLGKLREESILKSKYGYKVGGSISERSRRSALEMAVRPSELGLEAVAKHIANLIRLNRRRRTQINDDALHAWESDLNWLYDTYYRGKIYSFDWPS